jgi:hypothetical protein
MGKHLGVEEKLNAENELKENRAKIKLLQKEINGLKYRNKKLLYYLENRKNSKYKGLYSADGLCYKLYGKKASEMTREERREYDFIAKRIRQRKRLEDK